ncbi:hypothetical protein GCM10008908_28090 [Clostridium subterminale]|uniref:Erythromycin esterase n=1 Tax=Clostridium subterminale TaxID=1550 RepID=A0ABN1KTU4_CLOSU
MKGKKCSSIIMVMIVVIILGYYAYSNFYKVKPVDKYLADNYKTADFTEEGISNTFKLIDDSSEYDIFFTGEYHGMLGNEKISIEMLKYLNQKEGVRYLICELQYSIVSKLNQYIQNGDEQMLKEAIEVVRNAAPSYGGDDYYKFWQELYNYNKTLPSDKKIQAFGIDIDFQVNYTLNEMLSLIPNKEPGEGIKKKINDFKNILSNNVEDDEAIVTILVNLNKDINNNADVYKAFFGDNFNKFKNNLDSMMNTIKFMKNQSEYRDDLIYDNFIRIYNENPKGKYYGQFGTAHIFRENIKSNGEETITLAKFIEEKGNLKVLSMPISSSEIVIPKKDIEKLKLEKFTLFKLNGKNSPYKKGLENSLVDNLFELTNGSTVDNYQYVICFWYK